jgi:Raf kinase inhibitor-like YbhB/YbcL family protein
VKTPRVRSGLKVHPMIARLFGRLMRGVHAGEEKLIWNQPAVRSAPETIVLSSSAFQNGIAIPTRFAARSIGENQSPPLEWSNLPSGTAEIVLVMEDPDAPLPVTSMHLVVTAISPRTSGLPAGSLNSGTQSSQVRLGKGLMGRRGYAGPMPPPSHGPHRYVFQVFALGQTLRTDIAFDRKSLLREIDGKVLAQGRLIGTFERK